MSDSIDPDGSVEFTDREVRLITASLNGHIDERGRELLPVVLREWAATDLREHLLQEPREPITRRIEHFDLLAQHLDEAADLLALLDERGRIALKLVLEGFPKFDAADLQEVDGAMSFSQLDPERLRRLAAAAREATSFWKRGRGRPRNVTRYRILLDLAAIYEWAVGCKAHRRIDRVGNFDTGPFWDFAFAIWPVIFESDDGLSSGMKSWASLTKKYSEASPLIANINLRHPEWRIFDD